MRRVAILRPEPGASRTLERALALGIDAFAVPLFAVEPVAWQAPKAGAFDALLLTSANAVRHAGPALAGLAHLPVHAVGPATANAARAAGFDVVTVGTGTISDLVATLDPGARLLHLAGEDRADLGVASATTVIVYRARAVDSPPGLALIAGQVAMIHSPRAARRLGELLDHAGVARARVAIAAISGAAAAAAGDGWERVEAAREPRDAALLALAGELCK